MPGFPDEGTAHAVPTLAADILVGHDVIVFFTLVVHAPELAQGDLNFPLHPGKCERYLYFPWFYRVALFSAGTNLQHGCPDREPPGDPERRSDFKIRREPTSAGKKVLEIVVLLLHLRQDGGFFLLFVILALVGFSSVDIIGDVILAFVRRLGCLLLFGGLSPLLFCLLPPGKDLLAVLLHSLAHFFQKSLVVLFRGLAAELLLDLLGDLVPPHGF
ncbi:MAG: hypothetical protein BWX71_00597 [Deltaproteobacteria bacterium ADurb.Bin072]|nr:MAG: hypothetical protein BWX71_00597 [Deltaproteobacteria bacterium ADurb.Bin072]